MHRWSQQVGGVLLAFFVAGCASPYLEAGQIYLARGNLPVAIEMFDAGLQKDAGNARLRDALIVAQQTYQYELRQDADRLARSDRYLLALGRLLLLEESSRRGEQIQLPGELPRDIERERRGMVKKAVSQLDKSLDERAGRGKAEVSDLATCRQLQALVEDDPSIKRACDRLLAGFKLLAIVEAEAGTHPDTRRVFPALSRLMADRHPELIEIVDVSRGDHNAVMRIYLGEADRREQPWVMTERDAFHRWVAKLDRKGRPIYEMVTVQPSKRDIEKAKKEKKAAPKPKRVKKAVYELVEGEYRVFWRSRSVTIPYQIRIEDLRRKTIAASFSGTVSASSESRYHEYRGNPRAKKSAPTRAVGRSRAPALLDERTLFENALSQVPARVVDVTLERVEK